jgi:endoglucanase Acf2
VAAEDATGGQEKKSGYTSSGKEYRQGLGAAEDAFPWLLLLGAALGAILAGALVVRSFAASSSSEGRGGAMRGAGGRDATLPYSDLLLGKSLPIIPLPSMPHPMTPSALWGRSSGKPYPTGAFWTNFVIDNGDWAVGVLPYAVKCTSAGVQVSYGAWRRIVSKGAITDPFFADMQISALEAYLGHSVDSYDSFSVTMRFDVSGGLFRAPLVKGSPFVTAVFQGSTPTVSSELMQFIAVDVATMPANQPGSLRIVTLGNYQKWLVYCSATAPLIWNGNTLSTNVPISGFVRIAFIPKQNEAASIAILSKHLLRYPTGASA